MLAKFKNQKLQQPIIQITTSAWEKIFDILKTEKYKNMFFSASTGGCNGSNFNLSILDNEIYDEIYNKKPTILTNNEYNVYVDPVSEMFLMGTSIDYIKEDYKKNIYENKFVFKVDKNLLSSCGCGVSFSPKN